ncbi:MAG: hypothetical protein ACI8V2_004069 [Candidatus Latescibacterota bacterium]|jgi:hypothetical protein
MFVALQEALAIDMLHTGTKQFMCQLKLFFLQIVTHLASSGKNMMYGIGLGFIGAALFFMIAFPLLFFFSLP